MLFPTLNSLYIEFLSDTNLLLCLGVVPLGTPLNSYVFLVLLNPIWTVPALELISVVEAFLVH